MTKDREEGGVPLDIEGLVANLTLKEKASLLDGAGMWHTRTLDRLGVPAIMMTDGPHGLRKQSAGGDHLGAGETARATCFPPAAGLASSWDTALLTRVGDALGRECRAERVSVLLGPGVNMKRSPLCGRNFEYFSEDPVLAGELGAAFVIGVQSQGVGTSVKHFAANNQETARMSVSAQVDERTLREIYLPAFETVVTMAAPWTVMCSYNRLNGIYTSEDPWLLTELLRDEWGFDGLVVSDWGAVNRREAALPAGLDLEMPSSGGSGARAIVQAVEAGTVTTAQVDRSVRRVLQLVQRAQPALATEVVVDYDAHHALAAEAARESAVLLKNDGAILPLNPTEGGPVAVIGEFARRPRYQGAGSSQVRPTRVDDALSSLRAVLEREVTFAPGYSIEADSAAPELVSEAVTHAQRAATVVLFLGLPPAYESEGYDREDMDLPAHQFDLLAAIYEVNPNVVVVLSNGSVVTVAPWQQQAKALVEGWLLGQAGGSALADLLTGRANPSGKLAETIPMRYEENPTVGAFPGGLGEVRYGEGLLIGYRWYDARRLDVAYPFGHGLSYTTFGYDDLTVTVDNDGAAPRVTVELTVTNTGDRFGKETVQLYVGDPQATVFRPDQELRSFAKVALEPGQSSRVVLKLGPRAFSYWHISLHRWVVEGGAFEIRVGASSRDIRLSAPIELTGEDLTPPLELDAEIGDWLDHPAVGERLHRALEGTPYAGYFADPQHARMFRAIPTIRMARFPGFPVSEGELEDWIGTANH
ncbi:beta-glucosidase [Antricoccus suffuscus]|uniref:Exo-alpha-(1->6)-L-arabinopyranosidase n=1 Tax=Antricoccus suffuscus TaxID=1629062 RepID=A0A2T1A1L3_9ACTN|nr:glycoside hydrolase family 3 C-terminal domain-containing protein [Antricoccus suffuscus]PRZ42387.1 beta-glucosidase [Antricoccus suffuscus]